MAHTHPHRLATLLTVSVAGGCLFAMVFAEAIGVLDLIGPVALIIGTLAGLFVLPLYLLLSRRRLRIWLPIVYGAVLAEIVVVAPIEADAGFFGSFVALAVAVLMCRALMPAVHGRPSNLCAHCNYDLRGSPSSTCPECGRTATPTT